MVMALFGLEKHNMQHFAVHSLQLILRVMKVGLGRK